MPVLIDDGQPFDVTVPVLVVGAGACGLTAALDGTVAARIGAK